METTLKRVLNEHFLRYALLGKVNTFGRVETAPCVQCMLLALRQWKQVLTMRIGSGRPMHPQELDTLVRLTAAINYMLDSKQWGLLTPPGCNRELKDIRGHIKQHGMPRVSSHFFEVLMAQGAVVPPPPQVHGMALLPQQHARVAIFKGMLVPIVRLVSARQAVPAASLTAPLGTLYDPTMRAAGFLQDFGLPTTEMQVHLIMGPILLKLHPLELLARANAITLLQLTSTFEEGVAMPMPMHTDASRVHFYRQLREGSSTPVRAREAQQHLATYTSVHMPGGIEAALKDPTISKQLGLTAQGLQLLYPGGISIQQSSTVAVAETIVSRLVGDMGIEPRKHTQAEHMLKRPFDQLCIMHNSLGQGRKAMVLMVALTLQGVRTYPMLGPAFSYHGSGHVVIHLMGPPQPTAVQ
jgi:hypothetical protein